MSGKQLTDKEKATIEVLSADGQSPRRIGKQIKRSPHTVEKHLQEPEVQQKVDNERAILAEKYRAQAHRVLDSISDEDILKASLQQKSISSGILLDKALLLSGEGSIVDVRVLLQAVEAIRALRQHPEDVVVESLPEPEP